MATNKTSGKGKGTARERSGCYFIVRKGFTSRVAFKQGLEERQGASHVDIWEECFRQRTPTAKALRYHEELEGTD